MIRELANGRGVEYKGSTIRFPWAVKSRLEVWMAAYGPKALALTGEVADGFILQLADPDVVGWTVKAVREAAERSGRDPSAVTICVAAPAYVGDDLAHQREQCRWFGGMVGNHVADIVARYGGDGGASGVPAALTDYIKGRQGYDYNQHGQAGNEHAAFVPDAIVDRFCLLGPVSSHVERLEELRSLGVDQFAIYLQHDAKDETLAAYGERVMPAIADRVGRQAVGATRMERASGGRGAKQVLFGTLGALLVIVLWEGYKALGEATNDKLGPIKLPAKTDDLSMPHVWTILGRFHDPELRGNSRTVGQVVLEGVWYTLRVSMAGFVVGVLVGLALAVVMQRFRLAERSLLPYVILSQTVPLIALAPLVVGWGGQLQVFGHQWQPWMSVAVISSYLAFFPVAVGALRGLQSPSSASVELMDSYAASHWQSLRRLRFPAGVPYLVPALKLGAAAAVVGAIVAEISTGTRGGIGRLIIEYSREATSDPAKVYTAIVGAAALGLVVAGLVALFDLFAMRNRPPEGRP